MLSGVHEPKLPDLRRAAFIGLSYYLMAWGIALPSQHAPLEVLLPGFVIGLLFFVGLAVWAMRRGPHA